MEEYGLIAVIYMLLEVVSATCQEGCICESGICVRCKDRYSFNSTGCVKCSPRCVRCNEAAKCNKCEQAYGLQRGGCRPCGDGCANCTFDPDYVCFNCFEERVLKYNLCYRCPAHCQKCSFRKTCDVCYDGYYKQNFTSLCSQCPRHCKVCESSEKCLVCRAGFYGRLCEDKCSSGCLTNSCDIDTGYCQCRAGCYGQKCDNVCSSGCQNNRCDKETGYCNCKTGLYGHECKHHCANGCLNNSCEKNTGFCKCEPGFYGPACESECSINCLNNRCNKENGYCPCKVGFYGPGCLYQCPKTCLDCDIMSNCTDCRHSVYELVCSFCLEGKHGSQCNQNCPEDCKECNMDGNCTVCMPGFYGRGCESPCGDGCLNGSCVLDTGQCTYGCVSGTVPYCLQENNGFPLVPMFIGTCIVATLCIIVVIIVLKLKRNFEQVRLDNDNVEEDRPRESVSYYYSLRHFATTSDENEYSEINMSQIAESTLSEAASLCISTSKLIQHHAQHVSSQKDNSLTNEKEHPNCEAVYNQSAKSTSETTASDTKNEVSKMGLKLACG